MATRYKSSSRGMTFGELISRFVTAIIILGITALLTPGFSITSLWALVLSAIVLTILDYLIHTVFNIEIKALGHGIIGFLTAVFVLYATQFFVTGYEISWISALIGAFIYGIVASIIPGKQ